MTPAQKLYERRARQGAVILLVIIVAASMAVGFIAGILCA